jgi:hypothetical protein
MVLFSSRVTMGMILALSVLLWAGINSHAQTEDPNKKVIKQALVGAGTGAIAAEVSGGKAGTGALVGAGTNVIGSAVLDALTTPSSTQAAPQKKIIRHYDKDGRVVSEEEVWE